MNVINFIKENGLAPLKEAPYFIEVKEYPEGLVSLNYNQIDSPKHDPIVKECRGLILELNTWKVVARSFDRFFNYGECPHTKTYDIANGKIFDKIDGSLLTAYNYKGTWYVATRKMVFAEGTSAFGNTYRSVFDKAFDINKLKDFPDKYNLVFELVSPETRIVTPYSGYEVYLLTIRNRETGEEFPSHEVDFIAETFGIKRPKNYSMDSFDSMIEFIKNNKTALEEGFVCLWEPSFHRIKVKNPSYLAIAHMRENGIISEKRVVKLVASGDEEEYLQYFEDDRPIFEPYIVAFNKLKVVIHNMWEETKNIEVQKDFAMKVKDKPYSGIMFAMKKGATLEQALGKLSDDSVVTLVNHYKDKNVVS